MSDPADPNLVPDPPVPEPVEPEPAPAPEPEPAEPAEPDTVAAPANGIEKRFATYAERLRASEAREARLARMLEAMLAQGPQPKTAAPEPPPPTLDPLPPRPRRENFADPDAYDEAMDEYQATRLRRELAIARAEDEQHRKALTQQQQREAAEADQRTAMQRREDAWGQRMAKAEAEEPEWFDAYETVGNSITPVMGDAIKRASDGIAVVMYLHKNPEERQRIAALNDPAAVLYEMGKLEARLARPEPVVPPRQAPPMRPVGQRSAGSIDRDIHDIGNEAGTMNEYATKRLEQMAAARARH